MLDYLYIPSLQSSSLSIINSVITLSLASYIMYPFIQQKHTQFSRIKFRKQVLISLLLFLLLLISIKLDRRH